MLSARIIGIEIVEREIPELNPAGYPFKGSCDLQVARVRVGGLIGHNDEKELMDMIHRVIVAMGYRVMTVKDLAKLVKDGSIQREYVFLEVEK